MNKLIVANYKMNGNADFYKKVSQKVNSLKLKDTVVLCPPFVYMSSLKLRNEKVCLGSQDIAGDVNKKSTGQISPKMLKEFDAKYSIVGHSERREIGETDYMISRNQ